MVIHVSRQFCEVLDTGNIRVTLGADSYWRLVNTSIDRGSQCALVVNAPFLAIVYVFWADDVPPCRL